MSFSGVVVVMTRSKSSGSMRSLVISALCARVDEVYPLRRLFQVHVDVDLRVLAARAEPGVVVGVDRQVYVRARPLRRLLRHWGVCGARSAAVASSLLVGACPLLGVLVRRDYVPTLTRRDYVPTMSGVACW